MAVLQSLFKRLLFAAYVMGFTALPLGMLMGLPGAATGLVLAALGLLSLRYHGTQRLAKLLEIQPLPAADTPQIRGICQELARRLGLTAPQLGVIPGEGPNAAVFGFRSQRGWIVLTEGALKHLSRTELSALLARCLVQWRQGDVSGTTWLAVFFYGLERLTEPRATRTLAKLRTSHPVRLLIRQILVYPLTLIPTALLNSRTSDSELDRSAAHLCGSSLALGEALRKVEAYSERRPLLIPQCTQHLFLKTPRGNTPLARIFFADSHLGYRIRALEEPLGASVS